MGMRGIRRNHTHISPSSITENDSKHVIATSALPAIEKNGSTRSLIDENKNKRVSMLLDLDEEIMRTRLDEEPSEHSDDESDSLVNNVKQASSSKLLPVTKVEDRMSSLVVKPEDLSIEIDEPQAKEAGIMDNKT
mmetsp:Transcript_23457/g.28912  ORF Transcript_23457/g.28912 Transcript_23457/m.28912 type:complete len:135 (+) Transcript_23457:85-489(+)